MLDLNRPTDHPKERQKVPERMRQRQYYVVEPELELLFNLNGSEGAHSFHVLLVTVETLAHLNDINMMN